MKTKALALLIVLLQFSLALSQTSATEELDQIKAQLNAMQSGTSRFLLRGYAHSGLEKYTDKSSFVGGSFNPIFLWQQSDRLLFESELELELENGETVVNMEYADMSYLLTKRLTIRVGKFLVPFGIFNERIHPRWINRLPSNPLGFSHHDRVGPSSDLGVELRGGAPLGAAKINYSVYVVNGPTLNDGSADPDEAGILHYNNFEDNNNNKSVGGRFGFLPFYDSSLEVGFSALVAKVGDTGSKYEKVGARLYAVDFSFIKNLLALKSIIDIKAQWNRARVDKAEYISPDNPQATYTFDNQSDTYFAGLSLRPAYLDHFILKNLEFAVRYSNLKTPAQAHWGTNRSQLTFGINYWLDWRTVLKVGYQINTNNSESAKDEDHEAGSGNALLVHWSFGF